MGRDFPSTVLEDPNELCRRPREGRPKGLKKTCAPVNGRPLSTVGSIAVFLHDTERTVVAEKKVGEGRGKTSSDFRKSLTPQD